MEQVFDKSDEVTDEEFQKLEDKLKAKESGGGEKKWNYEGLKYKVALKCIVVWYAYWHRYKNPMLLLLEVAQAQKRVV